MNEENTVKNQEAKSKLFAEKKKAFENTLELAQGFCSPQGLEMIRQGAGNMNGFNQSKKGKGVKKDKFSTASQGYVAPRKGMIWDDHKKMEVKRPVK